MEQYKLDYNKLLTRYYKGCDYIEKHPDEFNELINPLNNILEKMNDILKEHPEATLEEVEYGFKEK